MSIRKTVLCVKEVRMIQRINPLKQKNLKQDNYLRFLGKNWRPHGESNPGYRRERPVS